jgi:cysteine-rich repeat protein
MVDRKSILILSLVFILISLGFASAFVCGNGIPEAGEECDNGVNNGNLCWASYGTSCTYCSGICTLETITNYCGDGIKQECETCLSCPADIGECPPGPPTCGDTICNGEETCSTCVADCGECPPPTCDHEIAVRYSYSNSYGTGIAVGYENGTWISEKPANLEKGTYKIKYFIDNKKEADDNVHIIVKLDSTLLLEEDKLIDAYSSKELDLNTLQLCGTHTISLEITSDGEECNLEDNHASREIYVKCEVIPPTCGDGSCNNGETCSTCPGDCGVCPPPTHVCGNHIKEGSEECDDGNLINGDGCSKLCKIEDNCDDDDDDGCEEKCEKDDLSLQFCSANWKCTGWSQCANGVMTRECSDENSCDSEYGKPLEQTGCDILSKAYVEVGNKGEYFWILFGIVIFIILVIIIVNLL